MDIYQETKVGLQGIWEDRLQRQQAKLVILKAISLASDVSVKVADEIMGELDTLLLEEKEDDKRTEEKGL